MIGEANFEEEVRNVMQFFETRQTLFSATMPNKIQMFAKTLVRVIVNVGHAGAVTST